jgi:hypothetical protein
MPDMARVRYSRSQFTFMSVDANLDVGGDYFKTLEGNFYCPTLGGLKPPPFRLEGVRNFV